MESKRVVVTGGDGFLGHHLVPLLQEAYSEVEVIHRKDFDLLREDRVKAMYRNIRPDIVIHLAANVGGIQYNKKNPAVLFYDNLQMGVHMIHQGHEYGKLEKFVCLGTICSYPVIPKHIPFMEDDLWDGYPEKTNAPYGVAKRSLEEMCRAYRTQYGMNCIYLMPVNMYGTEDTFTEEQGHVIPMLIKRFVDAKEESLAQVVVWGSGFATREFLYAGDSAKLILKATQVYNDSYPINLGSGRETSIADLAYLIAKIIGYKGEIIWDDNMPDGQPRRYLDTRRSEMWLGFRPENATTLEDGLKRTIDWYLKNRGNL